MKNSKIFITLAFAGMVLTACSGNKKENSGSDSSVTDSTMTDTTMKGDSSVKPADSTHSFRNDRGTDSVSAGKSLPAKP
jgi:hypothetical protein